MTILTAGGSFAEAYLEQYEGHIASIRELGEADFIKALKDATVIIHNAATVEKPDLELSVARNFDFTRFLVEKLHDINPKAHLILLSSMSILDPHNSQAYGSVLDMTPYAYSKYLAETYCLKSELPHVSCVRFSTLFFEDPKKDGLSRLIHDAVTTGIITIYNGGEAKRNFLPIRIATSYIQSIIQQPLRDKQTYTLAAPRATTFREVADFLSKQLPKLVVNDQKLANGNPVLADFTQDSVKRLGPIDFSLDAEMSHYINKLAS